ncbi:MAG: nucleotide exchange factor GrpE [Planctomycetota bacterium]|jgi:molecular chaperone GrpE
MNKKVDNVEANELLDTAEAEPTEDAQADEQTAETAEPEAGADAEQSVEEVVDPVEELQNKVASLEDSLLRAKADYQNLQRRSAQEHGQAIRFANAELMRSLLGVLDDFERSLEAAQGADTAASVVDGVRLVYDNLMKALRARGLESIEAVDKPFDPHVHEAMMQQPSADHPPGTVLAEVAKGYLLGERVLRPAKVIVSKDVETGQGEERDQAGKAEEPAKKKKSKRKHRDS